MLKQIYELYNNANVPKWKKEEKKEVKRSKKEKREKPQSVPRLPRDGVEPEEPPVLNVDMGPKLKPEGGEAASLDLYDCCAFIIHCGKHGRILTSIQEDVVWLPFVSLPPN